MAHSRSLHSLVLAVPAVGLVFGMALAMAAGRGPSSAARPAAPASPLQQTDTFIADADSFVSSIANEASFNFGGEITLRVGAGTTRGGLTNYRSFIRFDGVTRTIPAGMLVDQATLTLVHLGSPGDLAIVAEVVTDTWAEASITWRNQPGSVAPRATTTVSLGAGMQRWDVTAHVQAWVNGTRPNHGFALRPADESLLLMKPFFAREGGSLGGSPAVVLEVTWQGAPQTPGRTTPSATVTTTATVTRTPRATGTPGLTLTATAAAIRTASATPTRDGPATRTVTATATVTGTATLTPTLAVSPTQPPPITALPPELFLELSGGCGRPYAIGQTASLRVRSNVRGTVTLHRFPGGLWLADVEVEPDIPRDVPYLIPGPPGPQRLTAELVEDEGVSASCPFDVIAVATPTPSRTPGVGGFLSPPPSRPGIYLPFTTRRGLPSGPSGIAAPSAKAREGDVAWVSVLPHPPLIVSAAGNGANYRLSTWYLGLETEPNWIMDGVGQMGFDVRVHRLTAGDGSGSGIQRLLVSAGRRNGQLWLTTWQVTDAGHLVKLDTLGYGERQDVAGYALASRPVREGNALRRYIVVTPIVTTGDQARVISWSVDPVTGQLNGRFDTGDWQAIASQSDLDITYLPNAEIHLDPNLGFAGDEAYDTDRLFAMTFRNAGGALGQWILNVTDLGSIGWFGGGESGVAVRNNGSVVYNMTVGRVVPIGRSGFLTGFRDGGGDPDIVTWDYRSVAAANGLVPHRLGRASWDTSPDTKGVDLAQDNPDDANFIGDDVDGERALLTDLRWEDTGTGNGTMFSSTTPLKGAAGGMASVAKVMTLLLAIDALKAGQVKLDDVVVVPAEGAEGSPAWMSPPLAGGDQVELRTLLHGLMKRSSNGAARSIAWHVAGAKYGNGLTYAQRLTAFLADMNQRAAALGMADSLYCAPQGGSHSTPQDQVTLWRQAFKEPLFREFTGVNTYDPPCGKDVNNNPKCFADMSKGTISVPGLDGEKNGLKTDNGGVGYQGGVLACNAFASNSTFDACRQCRIGQVTRLGRSFLGAVLQSDSSAADVRALLEYGLMKRFTPDRRAQGTDLAFVPVGEEPTDFALASLNGEPAVSLVVTGGGKLRLCALEISAGLGKATAHACLTVPSPLLGPGGPFAPDVGGSVQMVRLDPLAEAEADVLTGHLVNNAVLRLRVWRVAARESSW